MPLKQMVLKTPSPESYCAGIKAGDERPAAAFIDVIDNLLDDVLLIHNVPHDSEGGH